MNPLRVKRITGMKKAMTKTMTQSNSIPFFSYMDEINCSSLLKLRRELKKTYPELSILPFFIKAASLSMIENPGINCHVNPETDTEGLIKEYVIKKDHNFSIAIDSTDGLTVPAIKKIQEKSILQINKELIDLRKKSESGQLTADDFADATFSISSVGNLGGTYFVPTILPPQAAIMAIGKARKVAQYMEDNTLPDGYKWEPIEAINISMSADHRVLDGASAIRFAVRMKDFLENPNAMLLNMN